MPATIAVVGPLGDVKTVNDVSELRSLWNRSGYRSQFGSLADSEAVVTAPMGVTLTGTIVPGRTVYNGATPVTSGTVTADAGQVARWARAGMVDVTADPLARTLSELQSQDAAFYAYGTVTGGALPPMPFQPITFGPANGRATLANEAVRVNITARSVVTLFVRADTGGPGGNITASVRGPAFEPVQTRDLTNTYGNSVSITGTATQAQKDTTVGLLPNDRLWPLVGATGTLRNGANIDAWLLVQANA